MSKNDIFKGISKSMNDEKEYYLDDLHLVKKDEIDDFDEIGEDVVNYDDIIDEGVDDFEGIDEDNISEYDEIEDEEEVDYDEVVFDQEEVDNYEETEDTEDIDEVEEDYYDDFDDEFDDDYYDFSSDNSIEEDEIISDVDNEILVNNGNIDSQNIYYEYGMTSSDLENFLVSGYYSDMPVYVVVEVDGKKLELPLKKVVISNNNMFLVGIK